jgi:hypothetical protein
MFDQRVGLTGSQAGVMGGTPLGIINQLTVKEPRYPGLKIEFVEVLLKGDKHLLGEEALGIID